MEATMSAGPEAWHGLVDPARLRVRHLEAGEALFRQGEPVTALHRLRGGRVRLVRCLEDGAARLGFAKLLAAQVRDLRARTELRGIRAAPERIVAWLRMRATGNPPSVVLDRTWTEVAAELGLTREATYRALARLEADGPIVRGENRVSLRTA